MQLLGGLRAGLGIGAAVADDQFELGAAQRLDAAGVVDLLDREFGADLGEIAVEREGAGDRLQQPDLTGAGSARSRPGAASIEVSATPLLSTVRRDMDFDMRVMTSPLS